MGKFGGTKRYVFRDDDDDYSSESDMEAGYDEIEYEEKLSRKIGQKEDAEELKRI